MKVEANAKVNFTLEVFGKRADGYHALRSVVMPISLSDTLDIEVTDDGSITSDTGYDDDLCVKAAKALRSARLFDCLDCSIARLKGARISVKKRIPAGGGLGGGSADAAAVLRALNELWKVGLSREELAEIGAQVGSDVPALVMGGPVVMEGRGEIVKSLEACACGDLSSEHRSIRSSEHMRTLNLVLVNPGVHSSTKEVYAACEARPLDGEDATAKMVEALRAGDVGKIAAALMNDLQTPALKLHPEIADVLVLLRTAGVVGALMSGSGSSVFGLVPDAASAERIAAELNAHGFRAWPESSSIPLSNPFVV